MVLATTRICTGKSRSRQATSGLPVCTKPLARRTLRVKSFEADLRTNLRAVVIRPNI